MRRQITPDYKKAQYLRKLAETIFLRIKSTDKDIFGTIIVKDYYEVIHALAESFSLEKGVKFSGEGAHKELLNFVAQEKALPEKKRIFLQELREYRNRINYEGLELPKYFLNMPEKNIQEFIRILK
jgi:uncharacterized coiled-coil DUF342 family protein